MALTAWLAPSMLPVYLHTLRVRVRRHRHGHTRHPGNAAAVIRACIEACWNGRTFTASPGHFDMFWTRDLGLSTPSLVRLGEGERVRASLAYALGEWTRRRSHVTTTINYGDRPADVFEYGVDSLPLLLASLRAAGAHDLVERHRAWLAAEVVWFAQRVVDPSTGLVRADRTYSAHRDTVVNRSTAYGNTMVALLAKTLAETRWLPSPFERQFEGDYGRLLREHFWVGDRFRDALGDDTVSGEANVWPFYAGVVGDDRVLASALRFLVANGFCDPYPLRYETIRRPGREVWFTRHVLPDYQGTTVWTSLGAIYLQLLRSVDSASARHEIDRYRAWIERDGTYWEVLDDRGRPWISPRRLFIGEESMLWSAIFLDLLEHGEEGPALLSPPLNRHAAPVPAA
jgi:hypothetical protein